VVRPLARDPGPAEPQRDPVRLLPRRPRPGKALLEQAGAAAATLPVVIMFDGRVLENPSNAQLAEAIGMRTSPGPACTTWP
jgi:hypothetical protein